MIFTTPKHHIRWMIKRDMPETVALLSAAYGEQIGHELIVETLRERNCIGMVLEDGRVNGTSVIGAMIYELHKNHLHILRLGVHPAEQELGFGTALLDKLIYKLGTHHRTLLTADIHEDRIESQKWFAKRGFRARWFDDGFVRMTWRKPTPGEL